MPRPPRIEFEGAVYHVMSRGNGRQRIVHDDRDRRRLDEGLEAAVERFDWRVLAYVWMDNHLHVAVRTPRPNLARGMQHLLSSYANFHARRHGRGGHLFQGRYQALLIGGEGYYWDVTRYVHLNPLRAGLVQKPQDWRWSSYGGYHDRRRRVPWVAYDEVLAAWSASYGGSRSHAADAYRAFVARGVEDPPPSPLNEARGGWILGPEAFVKKVRKLAAAANDDAGGGATRARYAQAVLGDCSLEDVMKAVCREYRVGEDALRRRGDGHPARAAAAWLVRRHTPATLADVAPLLGLSRPESVPNLTRKLGAQLREDAALRRQITAIERRLGCG